MIVAINLVIIIIISSSSSSIIIIIIIIIISRVRAPYACWNFCIAGSGACFNLRKCVTTKFTESWFIIASGI